MAIERVPIMLIKSGQTYQEVKPYEFNKELTLIKQVVNGLIQFGDLEGNNRNMFGEMQQLSFGPAATEVRVRHNLGSVPIGYLVLRNENGGVVFDGTSTWSSQYIYVQSTTANNNVLIFILG